MPSSAEDISQYLETQGLGTEKATSGWGIFIGLQPSRPDTVITVYDVGGNLGNPDQLYDPMIQIRVRSHDYSEAYAKAEAIRDELAVDKTARIIGDWLYTGFWVVSDIEKIDTDENNRNVLSITLRLMREPNTTA